jgi:uncharacterized membrane protein
MQPRGTLMLMTTFALFDKREEEGVVWTGRLISFVVPSLAAAEAASMDVKVLPGDVIIFVAVTMDSVGINAVCANPWVKLISQRKKLWCGVVVEV